MKFRSAARRWNVEGRHGALGDTYFWLLKMEQFEKTWQHDGQGGRTYTMLRLRNPIMDGIRRFGLHPLQEETQTNGQGMVHLTSFADTLLALSGNQIVDAQLHQADTAWACSRNYDDNASMPSVSFLQIWAKCGSTGAQEVRTGTARVRVKLLTELRRGRGANIVCQTFVTCWRSSSGISTRIPGIRRCLVYAHDCRKME